MPVSAMKRNGEPSASEDEPAATDDAFQNLACTSFAWRMIFIWSSSLVMMMYQEPIDMIDMMMMVPRGTQPDSHTALMPNGVSISSLPAAAPWPPAAASAAGAAAASAGAAAGAAAASAAGAAAGASAAAGAGASARAGALTRAVAAVTENSTAASTADKRVFLNMLPPN